MLSIADQRANEVVGDQSHVLCLRTDRSAGRLGSDHHDWHGGLAAAEETKWLGVALASSRCLHRQDAGATHKPAIVFQWAARRSTYDCVSPVNSRIRRITLGCPLRADHGCSRHRAAGSHFRIFGPDVARAFTCRSIPVAARQRASNMR